jgi:DnaK suppressor protein
MTPNGASKRIQPPAMFVLDQFCPNAISFSRHGCCVRPVLNLDFREACENGLRPKGLEQRAMSTNTSLATAQRIQNLRQILNHERTVALERVREIRQVQDQDVAPPPSDELDVARSLADVEMHASLIEQGEFRLKAIDRAFSRVDQGRYGVCEDCGEEIPLERLSAVPFTVCCVSCQQARNRRRRPVKARLTSPHSMFGASRRKWMNRSKSRTVSRNPKKH